MKYCTEFHRGDTGGARQTGNNTIVIYREVDYHIVHSPAVQLPGQEFRLAHGARVAIEDKPFGRIGFVQPSRDHFVDNLVEHQHAGVHFRREARTQLGALPDPLTQHIPG